MGATTMEHEVTPLRGGREILGTRGGTARVDPRNRGTVLACGAPLERILTPDPMTAWRIRA